MVELGLTERLPEVGAEPDKPPVQLQEVVLIEDQVKLEDPPWLIEIGLALKLRTGTGVTQVGSDTHRD